MSKRDRENEKFIRDIVREQIKSEPVTDEQYLKVLRAHQKEELLKAEKKAKRRFFKPALVSCLSIVLVVVITLMSVYLPQRNGGGDQIIDGGNTSEPSENPTPTPPPHFAEEDLINKNVSLNEIKNYYSGNVQISGYEIEKATLYYSKIENVPCYLYLKYGNLFLEEIVLNIVLTKRYNFEVYHNDYNICKEELYVNNVLVYKNTKIIDIMGYGTAKFSYNNCDYFFVASYLRLDDTEDHIKTIVKQLLA